MPPDETLTPDDPRAWIRLAREDLNLAEARVPGVGFGLMSFHAQQAAEKAIKSVLLKAGVAFPYVHDLGRLLDLLTAEGVSVPASVAEADLLTDYATLARYPGNGEIGEHDYEQAVTTARAVVEWAERIIGN